MDGATVDPIDAKSVVTIGVFDGVHRGHQQLLADVRADAQARGAQAVVVTFWPHPLAVLAPDHAPARLTSIERRVELLRTHGADHVQVLDFTAAMSAWSPAEFLDRVVRDQCGAEHVVVGENFRFGAKAAGDIDFLIAHGVEHGLTATGRRLIGDGESFSSTRVRAALGRGDVAAAATILGRPPEVDGVVVHGDHRGRDLGFPTANVQIDEAVAAPLDGVYAGWLVRSGGERLPAAISVGTNPTFDGHRARRVESYVLDRTDLDLYDEHVRIEFVEHIRPMAAFESVEELIRQMDDDVARTRQKLAVLP